MKNIANKKIIISVGIVALLLSALLYNILYINNEKNAIIEEIEAEESIKNEETEEIEETKTIFVDIGGEIKFPGMYELPENSRINDAVNIAGGVTDKADLTDVNLAYVLSDAMKIVIPKKEINKVSNKNTVKSTQKIVTTEISLSENKEQSSYGLVNINTGTKEQLKTLTGIGDSTAQKIIEYRNENGKFENIEAIKNVSGIGDSKYEKIKDKINI